MLLPVRPGSDTLVVGPYKDLMVIYANWHVAKEKRRDLVWELHAKDGLVATKDERISILEKDKQAALLRGDIALDMLGEARIDLMECGAKNSKLKTMATIGTIATVGVCVGLVTTAVVVVMDAIKK